jgi:hypothetical protein
VFIDGVLVPLLQLVNGATIRREADRGPAAYFHIGLERHDLLMTEGLPVESSGMPAGEVCAPRVNAGPKLSFIRRRLHEIALQAGFILHQDSRLQAYAGQAVLQPEIHSAGKVQAARFLLPPGTSRLLLLAQSAAPAETDPDSDDRREVSICLRQPRAKGQRLTLGQGWHAAAKGDLGRWMGGTGEILLPPDTNELTLHLTAIVQSWRRQAGG